jgi:hypothetical protein
LVSPSIVEDIFLAPSALDESPGDWFPLVRSTAPQGRLDHAGGHRIRIPPARIISTDLPYDDPYAYAGHLFWY